MQGGAPQSAAEQLIDEGRVEVDGRIVTELRPAQEAGPFYYAEGYHQQYLQKNPGGYCNHGPNGYTCPVGLLRQDEVPAQADVLPPS